MESSFPSGPNRTSGWDLSPPMQPSERTTNPTSPSHAVCVHHQRPIGYKGIGPTSLPDGESGPRRVSESECPVPLKGVGCRSTTRPDEPGRAAVSHGAAPRDLRISFGWGCYT
jgi:hypothetical protein